MVGRVLVSYLGCRAYVEQSSREYLLEWVLNVSPGPVWMSWGIHSELFYIEVPERSRVLDVIVSLANDSNLPLSELCPQLKNERVSTCRYATSQENMASGCIGRTASKPRLGPALWVDKIV